MTEFTAQRSRKLAYQRANHNQLSYSLFYMPLSSSIEVATRKVRELRVYAKSRSATLWQAACDRAERCRRFARSMPRFAWARKKAIGFALVLVTLIWYAWNESSKPVIILELVSVPKAWQDSGLTSESFTLEVKEKLEQIQQANDLQSSREHLLLISDEPYPEIEVPILKISLPKLIDVLRWWRGTKPQELRGELNLKADRPEMQTRCDLRFADGSTLSETSKHPGINAASQAVDGIAFDCAYLSDTLGAYFLKLRDYSSALRIADRMLLERTDTNFMYARAHILRGAVAADQGNFQEAVSQNLWATRQEPKAAVAHLNLGYTLMIQHRFPEAEPELKEAERLEPGSAATCTSLGIELLSLGQKEQALKKLRKCIGKDSKYAVAHLDLCFALEAINDYRQALAECQTAVSLQPENSSMHEALADILLNANRVDDALTEDKRAIFLNPNSVAAYDGIGFASLAQEKAEEARIAFDKASRLNLAAAEPHDGLGWSLSQMKRFDEGSAE